ncbi:hypothetical protein CEQ21_26835 [Niallia circulans]|uniref:Uncharacterized protein n=1 Tax=Niallia circulans TaxID=1397 RepID=A0A553SPU3_NIACI|nr:hypothetical protein [Niallia circulans]TRZ38976.1 hypothetical protein CEQ21_26835 [Niallia circulans]
MSLSVSNSTAVAYLQWAQKTASEAAASTQDSSQQSFQDMLISSSQLSNVPSAYTIAGVNNTTDYASLTTDQKLAFLENMQAKAEKVGNTTDATLPEGLQTAFNTISDLLSDFTLNESSEEDITSLFDQITTVLEDSKPQGTAMPFGAVPPPNFAETSVMDETYSVEQMSQFLADLISSFNTDDEDDEKNSILTDSLSENTTNQLSSFDLGSASEEQITSLFESIIAELEAAKQEQTNSASAAGNEDSETSAEAFPNSIQLSGTSLPPINWKPTTNTAASTYAAINSASFY